MPGTNDCWGIEVGSNAIKAIRLRRSGDETSVVDFEVIPFKHILTTPDLNVEEEIRVGLDKFLSRHDLKKSTVVVSIPGHMAFARFAKLPPVEPKRIPDIVRFEAVQQIPFPIEQVEWDYQTFQDPESPDVEVGIFAITKERLAPWLQNFQAVGMPVHSIVLSPVAAFNAMSHDLDLAERSEGTIFMDIGTLATDLIITEGGRVWLRTIPIGGNHFTEALVKGFKLSFRKAEKLKREAASSKYARQIFQAMRPVFVDLVQEVQKSLGYYQSLNRDANLTKLVGLGSTWRLPGLQTFLKQQLQTEVTRLDSFRKIEAEGRDAATFADNTISLAPAYGLALQGINLEAVTCNLLPAPVIRRQLWKAKAKWFVAAAAIVLLGVGVALGNLMLMRASYNAAENQSARRQVQQIITQTDQALRDWQKVEDAEDPRPRIGNINGMLDYRSLWPALLRDVDEAILSLKPQAALLGGDVDTIKQIDRRQRRIVYIEDLTAVYQYQPAGDERGGSTGAVGVVGPNDLEGDPNNWQNNPPSYLVTLVGTTPYDQPGQPATDFLEDNLVAFLKQNAERAGRPYRIATDSVKIKRITRITGEDAKPDGGAPAPDAPGGFGGPGGPGGFGGFGAMPDEDQPDIAGDTGDVFNQLRPRQVIEKLVQPGDTRFEIQWRLLYRPPGSETAPPAQAQPDQPDHADTEDQA